MKSLITTFPAGSEFSKATAELDALSLPYRVISPEPGFSLVGVPALVLDESVHRDLAERSGEAFTCAGWVDYREAGLTVPDQPPPVFADDVFGQAAVMVLAPCVADLTKLRLIVHIGGDLGAVFPYLNACMKEASYNPHGPVLTFLDRYRMVVLYPRRIALAKADDIVDAWRVLEMVRCRANQVWADRGRIEPSWETRQKPPALEIFKRLPGINCKACGEQTCLAFALQVWNGQAAPSRCAPVFEGEYRHLKPALLEICAGLGVIDPTESGVTT